MADVPLESEKYCWVLVHAEKSEPPTADELGKKLESKSDKVKVEALEELILLMINGEPYTKLLMTVIRFVVTSNDHRVKKLLMIYWELVEKTKENGDLKEEMILVCNALRNDLMHPNEYVRGLTLRLLCRMKYYRILEPLKEAVMRNLGHRHSYVRRNAVMCVYSIVKTFGIEVMPTATEDVEQLLLVEGDLSTKRNAFLMLLHCDLERATKYLFSMQDQVSTMGDIFQLTVLECVRKGCRATPGLKGRFLRIVFELATASSMAVSYDCASSLIALSSSPVAVHQAATAYVKLLVEQSDNNVKLIVLDRLRDVRRHHKQVMEGLAMDILRALTCPSLDVRRKAMDICLGNLVSGRNVKDVVTLLKKEVIKTMGQEAQGVEGNSEYRRLLIRALHATTSQHVEQAQSVMFLLMDFLTESDQKTATEVVMFLRELVANYPDLRTPILNKLADVVGELRQSPVIRGCLWLFGEYAEDEDLVQSVIESLLTAIKPFPLITVESEGEQKEGSANEDKKEKPQGKMTSRTVVLTDGTYGTQNVYEPAEGELEAKMKNEEKKSAVRNLLVGGDFLLSTMVGVVLTKLSLKLPSLPTAMRNEALFVMVSLLKLVQDHVSGGEKCDSAVRLTQCIRAFTCPQGKIDDGNSAAAGLVRLEWSSTQGRDQLAKVLELAQLNSEWALGGADEEETTERLIPPEESINFRQLRERKLGGAAAASDGFDDDDFNAARGALGLGSNDGSIFVERFAKVTQMTGLADPVYVEAFLQVHSFDVVLELLIVNRTTETLQNVVVELDTQGDLKLVDRPAGVTLAPHQQVVVHASIKVSSTETGIIFGYVTYEKKSAVDKECTCLNELHIDILDYIECAWIGELAFRTMWSEFEWENKININTSITEAGVFLEHIMRNTNMSIVGRNVKKAADKKASEKKKGKLTAEDVQEQIKESPGFHHLIQHSSFVAVNLYSKSIFGEDALANVSIEKLPDGKLAGSIRIRSRQQGIALSLGDRITVVQRGLKR